MSTEAGTVHTAVVDGASDAAFRAVLHDHVLPTGTAVLTVAHRLATAREADHVIILAGGQVEEQGEPAALLTTRSRFADLAALESGRVGLATRPRLTALIRREVLSW